MFECFSQLSTFFFSSVITREAGVFSVFLLSSSLQKRKHEKLILFQGERMNRDEVVFCMLKTLEVTMMMAETLKKKKIHHKTNEKLQDNSINYELNNFVKNSTKCGFNSRNVPYHRLHKFLIQLFGIFHRSLKNDSILRFFFMNLNFHHKKSLNNIMSIHKSQ